MKSLPSFSAALAFCLSCASIGAAPVAEDTFKNISNDTPAAVTSELTWKKIANVKLSGTASLKGDSSALQADFINYGKLYTVFPSTVIPDGGSLQLTLRFRYAAAPEPAANALRVGLENLTDPENPLSADAQPGYLLFINPGEDTAAGNAFAVEAGTDGSMGGGQDFKGYGTGFPSVAFGTGLHTLTFTLTRTGTGTGMDTTVKIDDGEATTASDAAATANTFNTLLIAVGNLPSALIIVEKATIELITPAKN